MDRERGEEDEGGGGEESSLQLLTHALATAITNINELWVKHAKLSHRSSWSPCVSESVKRKQNLDRGEEKSLSQPAIERGMKFRSDRVYERMRRAETRARDRRWLFPRLYYRRQVRRGTTGIETPRKSFVHHCRSIVIRAVIPRG